MTEKPNPERQTNNFIETAVKEHWDSYTRALLMSNLGVFLKKNVPESDSVIKTGIKKYLQQWPIVQEVQFPGIKEKIGLVPLGVDLPDDVTELFAKKNANPFEFRRPVYQQDFWRAFFRPLESVRFVVIKNDDDIAIVEGKQLEQDSGAYEVLSSDIVSTSAGSKLAEKVEATHQKIDAWLDRYSLKPSLFLKKRMMKNTKEGEGKLFMLREAFYDLSPEEQSRISIPVDILLKLI